MLNNKFRQIWNSDIDKCLEEIKKDYDKIDGISGRIVNNIFHKCGKNMKKNDLSKKIEYKENIYND